MADELDGDGGHTYRRINVTRAHGYMIGSNADGFHSIDVGTGPTIVDSEISYTLDDICQSASNLPSLVMHGSILTGCL